MSNAPSDTQSDALFDVAPDADPQPDPQQAEPQQPEPQQNGSPEAAKADQSASERTPVSDYVPGDETPAAAPEKDDIERLLEDPTIPLSLQSGTGFTIRQLRMREMLRLLRIVSRGSATMLSSMDFNFDEPDEFVQTFVAMVIFSIPEAENETIDFVQSMVEPDNLTGEPKIDDPRRDALESELENPDMEDAITIVTAIVAHEGRDLAALGKRLRSLLTVANKMGQVPDAAKPVAGG